MTLHEKLQAERAEGIEQEKNMPVKQTADGMYDKYAVFKS